VSIDVRSISNSLVGRLRFFSLENRIDFSSKACHLSNGTVFRTTKYRVESVREHSLVDARARYTSATVHVH